MTYTTQLGYKRYITESDMFSLLGSDEAHALGDKLHAAMRKHSALWVALFAAYGGPFAFAVQCFFSISCECPCLKLSFPFEGFSQIDSGQPFLPTASVIAIIAVIYCGLSASSGWRHQRSQSLRRIRIGHLDVPCCFCTVGNSAPGIYIFLLLMYFLHIKAVIVFPEGVRNRDARSRWPRC